MKKISGVRPEVVEGEPQRLPERGIWVGFQPVVKTLFHTVGFDFKDPEEILIAASQNHLVIAGRDRWDIQHMDVRGKGGQARLLTLPTPGSFLAGCGAGIRDAYSRVADEVIRKRIELVDLPYCCAKHFRAAHDGHSQWMLTKNRADLKRAVSEMTAERPPTGGPLAASLLACPRWLTASSQNPSIVGS